MLLLQQSELFQEDLYPDTPGDIPAVTAEEWWEGQNKDPIVMSLKGEESKLYLHMASLLPISLVWQANIFSLSMCLVYPFIHLVPKYLKDRLTFNL